MPKPVTIYTANYCPHCQRAKALLKRKGVPFREIDVTDSAPARAEAERKYGLMTVPIIVIGEKCIGGADELYALEAKKELDRILE